MSLSNNFLVTWKRMIFRYLVINRRSKLRLPAIKSLKISLWKTITSTEASFLGRVNLSADEQSQRWRHPARCVGQSASAFFTVKHGTLPQRTVGYNGNAWIGPTQTQRHYCCPFQKVNYLVSLHDTGHLESTRLLSRFAHICTNSCLWPIITLSYLCPYSVRSRLP